jgi:hypothetical protein
LDPNWVQLTSQKDWVRDWKKATLVENVFEEKPGGIFVNEKGYKGVYLSTKDSKALTFLSYESDLKCEYNSITGFTAWRMAGGWGSNPLRRESIRIKPKNYENVRFWMHI